MTRRPSFGAGGVRREEGREDGVVHAAAVRFELHVPQSRSLKAKRQAVRPIVDGLRHRFKVSVAEVDHHQRWQRCAIGVALVAESSGHLREILDGIERFVATAPDVELLDTDVAWLESQRS